MTSIGIMVETRTNEGCVVWADMRARLRGGVTEVVKDAEGKPVIDDHGKKRFIQPDGIQYRDRAIRITNIDDVQLVVNKMRTGWQLKGLRKPAEMDPNVAAALAPLEMILELQAATKEASNVRPAQLVAAVEAHKPDAWTEAKKQVAAAKGGR